VPQEDEGFILFTPLYSDVTADVMTLQIKVFRCFCVFFVPFFKNSCFVSDRAKTIHVTDCLFLSACNFERLCSYLWGRFYCIWCNFIACVCVPNILLHMM